MKSGKQPLVLDSSTLIALIKGKLLPHPALEQHFQWIIPALVYEEITRVPTPVTRTIEQLVQEGKVNVYSLDEDVRREIQAISSREKLGVGEISCCFVAEALNIGFFLCDDHKFIRRLSKIKEPRVANKVPLGFAFILATLFKMHHLDEETLKELFHRIVNENNWKNSIVEISNRRFLFDTLGIWVG
ncbi:MAG: hypothetical protein DRI61_04205 [Chloroflexi bacterium]|nr:MAG: hypothetical protein DRI61_04205 [Chloroflexota bacterium]